MTPQQEQYWKRQIDAAQKYMAPKHRLWRRLLKQYALEFNDLQIGDARPIKISRFYPLARQIMASVTFKYPEIFFHVEDEDREMAAEILQRVANSALDQMNAMPEVRQATFDALFCYVGWLKMGYNPPGDDTTVPYIANDAMGEDMPFLRRVSAFNVFAAPNTPPQSLAYAEFVAERMLVPIEFLKDDARFTNKKHITPIGKETSADDEMLHDMQDNPFGDGEEVEAMRESIQQRRMALIWEIHDRTHRQRYTFVQGGEDGWKIIEEIDHPFLKVEAETQRLSTGEVVQTGNYTPTGGYIVKGGFPYIPLRYDMPGEAFYGLPPMAYAEDTQRGIIESVSRRQDYLKRNARVILGQRREMERNSDLEERIKEGEDGAVAWVEDVNQSFSPLRNENIPQDQLGIESDYRQYEEQILQVAQQGLAGSVRTATESSLIAGFGQLNREWMQAAIAQVYETATYNILRIMADPRYLPQNFLVNVAKGEDEPVIQAVTADMLAVRFKVDIIAGSMQPLTEELERQDTLALVNYLIGLPEVNREEVIRMVLRTFRVPNQERIMGPAFKEEAIRAAQLENQAMIMSLTLGDPQVVQVLPNQDHDIHAQVHGQMQQDPLFAQLPPALQQQATQLVQQHVQMHGQALQAKAQQGAVQGNNQVSVGDLAGTGSLNGNGTLGMVRDVLSQTRSNAQNVSQAVTTNPEQN